MGKIQRIPDDKSILVNSTPLVTCAFCIFSDQNNTHVVYHASGSYLEKKGIATIFDTFYPDQRNAEV